MLALLASPAEGNESPRPQGNGQDTPHASTPSNSVVEVEAGESFACARFDFGAVKCWGINEYGQLGLGNTATRGDQPGEMGDYLPYVDLGTDRIAVDIAVGARHACARLDNGTLKCWGNNDYGQLGLGEYPFHRGDGPGEMGDSLPYVNLGAGRTPVEIAAGYWHTCARLDNGMVKCWGANWKGQLGLGDIEHRGDRTNEMGDLLSAVDLGSGRTALELAAGEEQTCARLDNGTVQCWGNNAYGQLGLGDTENRGDESGEMGDDLSVVDLGQGRAAVSLAAGWVHTCATLDDGTIKCWGGNSYYSSTLGQLGLGDTSNHGDEPNEMGDALPPVDLGADRTSLEIRAGATHTCVVFDDGALKCWGGNYGALGLGDTGNRGDGANEMGDSLPQVDLGTGRSAVSVAPGAGFTCALLDNGTVKCWGGNSYGRLGLGDTANRGDDPNEMGDNLPAVDLGSALPESTSAATLVTGDYHTCARLIDGRVKCWGLNDHGQLGLGDTINRGDGPSDMGDTLPSVNLGTGHTAVELVAGASHTCARLDDGTVKCWGANSAGQLGLGHTADRGDAPNEMGDALPSVNLGSGRTAVELAAGAAHICALLDNGSVKCWGSNFAGQLGLGDTSVRGDGPGEMGDSLDAVSLGTGRKAADLSAGGNHSCARLDNGSVKCWGLNLHGELGLGDIASRGDGPGEMGDSLLAVNVGAGRTAVQVSAGDNHTCGRLDNGATKCWGYNLNGQLGLGDTESRGDSPGEMGDALPAVTLGTGRSAVRLAAGQSHTCARLDNGSAKCWGLNNFGQLGLGNIATRGDGPNEMGDQLPIVGLGGQRTLAALAAGAFHTCARLDNRQVKCWGRANLGQVGTDDMTNRGDGPGEMGDALPPVRLAGYYPESISTVAVAAGDAFACALLEDGKVKCWGDNYAGVLGLGDTTDRGDEPGDMGGALPTVDLGTGRKAMDLVAGNYHACVRLDNGAVKCWGYNYFGQLGLGDKASRGDHPSEMGDSLPSVDLGAGRIAVELSAGFSHTCARLDDGTVKCWGSNSFGELGLGDTADRGDGPGEMGMMLPVVNLGTGRTAIGLAAGASHTCALLDNGTVKCWGRNNRGQFGSGDTSDRGDTPGEMGDSLTTVDLGTGRTAVELSAGGWHTCARLNDGALKCWGSNEYGQLGLGDTIHRGDGPAEMGDSLPLVQLGAGRTIVAIKVGSAHTCAVLDNGTVKCWGINNRGQLGLGNTAFRGVGPGQMGDDLPAVNLGSGRTVVALTVGGSHTCAVLDNGAVKCWGYNVTGQLGLGDTDSRGDGPNEMGDYLQVVDLGGFSPDVNCDGTFTAFDALRVLRILAGLDVPTVDCGADRGDADNSGSVGLGDSLFIRRRLAGLQ